MKISEIQRKKLSKLLDFVITSKKSDFYSSHFKKSYTKNLYNANINIDKFPFLTYKDLVNYPFLKRLYVDSRIYTQIVYHTNYLPLLIGRTTNDTQREPYRIPGNRPLVFFKSPHEGTQKCLWLYMHNILPLISDRNLKLTINNARQYVTDSMWLDMNSLEKMFVATTPIAWNKIPIYIFDRKFDMGSCKKIEKVWNIHFSIDLPEVGLIATACREFSSPHKVFHPVENIIAEYHEGELVVTQLIPFPTPIIRYKTGLKTSEVSSRCGCDESKNSFILESE